MVVLNVGCLDNLMKQIFEKFMRENKVEGTLLKFFDLNFARKEGGILNYYIYK